MSQATLDKIKNIGWRVALAGLAINLALGVLYTWSRFTDAIEVMWGWSRTDAGQPYSWAVLFFALATIPGGRMQDKFGPRITASIGGILVGVGMLICAFANQNYTAMNIGFGVIAGIGIGLAYASATPPAVKWFTSNKIGLIAGIVVSGFGLASAYIAPLIEKVLLPHVTVFNLDPISSALFVLGVFFLIVIVGFAQLLKTPPAGYKPTENAASIKAKKANIHGQELGWTAMIKTPSFWLLWLMYVCGAGVGLMMISQIYPIAKGPFEKAGLEQIAFLSLVILALGNGGGRVLAGYISDKIGRTVTMLLVFAIQGLALVTMLLMGTSHIIPLYFVLFVIFGCNYGACLSVFPAACKDFFGIKNFGLNYGILFTAWGVGGCILAKAAAKTITLHPDGSKDFTTAFIMGIAALALAVVLTFVTKAPRNKNATVVENN